MSVVHGQVSMFLTAPCYGRSALMPKALRGDGIEGKDGVTPVSIWGGYSVPSPKRLQQLSLATKLEIPIPNGLLSIPAVGLIGIGTHTPHRRRDGLKPNHSLRSAVIGSTAEARLAGNRQANAATPSSRNDAARRMSGLPEVFSTH
jgi:hypothetical protein